jgi:hypothetical protein
MKRLLSVALMVLVTLVGMVGFSRAAADPPMQTVFTQVQNIQQTLSAISNAVSALQASANATNGAVSKLQATGIAVVAPKHKMYYLTVTSFTGGGAITACDSRFHMASLSEIQDPSNLQYAIVSIPAYEVPPVTVESSHLPNHSGWIRTGEVPFWGYPDNCDFWMSSSDRQSGTTMTRYSSHGSVRPKPSATDPITSWHKTLTSCALPEHVWCIEDPD